MEVSWALDGMGGRMHVPAVSHTGQNPDTGGCVGLVAGLDGCEDLIFLK